MKGMNLKWRVFFLYYQTKFYTDKPFFRNLLATWSCNIAVLIVVSNVLRSLNGWNLLLNFFLRKMSILIQFIFYQLFWLKKLLFYYVFFCFLYLHWSLIFLFVLFFLFYLLIINETHAALILFQLELVYGLVQRITTQMETLHLP